MKTGTLHLAQVLCVPYSITVQNLILMPLSSKTIQDLSSALLPEVMDYIMEDERWIDFLHEIIPDAVQNKLGDVDNDLKFELGMCIMDKICFKVAS